MEKESRLEYFPISFFATVMGLSGLTIAWQRAEMIFQIPFSISPYILGVTILVFIILFITYGIKIMKYSESVKKELHHPVKLSFFPAISISLILISIAVLPLAMDISKMLWSLGTVLHLVFTLYVMNVWINQQHFKIEHMNPAWFIPLVGNILVPIAGVPHGFTELSWFFFSVGILFWLVLLVIVFYRLIFHHPVPAKLLPTFFILIAPPAIGFLSYFNLAGQQLDMFGRFLYYTGLFFTLMLFTQVLRFTRLTFALSWWAYSFPLAAITISTLVVYHTTGEEWFQAIAIYLLFVLSIVLIILITRTIYSMKQKGICIRED